MKLALAELFGGELGVPERCVTQSIWSLPLTGKTRF